MCSETFPKGDGAVCTAGHDPGVWNILGFGAHTYISIQSKSQQQTTQQRSMILTVTLTAKKHVNKCNQISRCSQKQYILIFYSSVLLFSFSFLVLDQHLTGCLALFLHRNAIIEHHCSCLTPPPTTGALSWANRLTKRAACRGLSSNLPARSTRTYEHTGRFTPFSSWKTHKYYIWIKYCYAQA